MKKLLIIILSLLLCNVIHAQKITELQALEKAKAFMTGKTFSNKERSLRRAMSNSEEDVNDAYYIFNADDNNGFVIVSGDERTEDIQHKIPSAHWGDFQVYPTFCHVVK